MQIPSRFSIAIHICMCLEFFDEDSRFNAGKNEKQKKYCKPMTGEALAQSVGAHSVIIRNILAQLKSANLIETRRGGSGAKLAKSAKDISLLDIFNAVQSTKTSELSETSVNTIAAKSSAKKDKLLSKKASKSTSTQNPTSQNLAQNPAPNITQNQLFRFHANPNTLCPLGKHIHCILDSRFLDAQKMLESYLASVALSDLMSEVSIELSKV